MVNPTRTLDFVRIMQMHLNLNLNFYEYEENCVIFY